MYTYRKTRTSKSIPPAEPKQPCSSEVLSRSGIEQDVMKSPKKRAATSSLGKRAKKNTGIFNGKSFYFVPVEMSRARRELFNKRVEEHDGVIARELFIDGEKSSLPNYVVVDDRVGLETLCQALDRDYLQSGKLLELLNRVAVVRSKWLSLCLHGKILLDDTEWKINQFAEVC
jgi:hypothetical protein